MPISKLVFPGMEIIVYSRATPTGQQSPLGKGVVLSKLGDVPNLYNVRITGDHAGLKAEIGLEVKAFVYPEDIIESG